MATGPGHLGSYSSVGLDKKSLLIFESATGKCWRELQGEAHGSQHVVFSAADNSLAISERYNRIRIWNLDTGKQVRDIPCPIGQYTAFDLSPDGRVLAIGVGPCIQLWDTATGQRLLRQQGPERPPIALTCYADGKRSASIDADAVAPVWNSQTGRHSERLEAPPPGDQYHYYPFEAPILIFNPQGKVQVLGKSRNQWGNQDGNSHTMVHQVDLATKKLVQSYGSHQTPVGSFAVSEDGQTLAGVMGRHIRLWKTATGKESAAVGWDEEIAKAKGDNSNLPRPPILTFSPDGRIIASRGYRQVAADKLVVSNTLWELPRAKIRHHF